MGRPNILLAQPLNRADGLVSRVGKAGYLGIEFPALSIEAVADPGALDVALAHLHQYGLVVFVSPNAIDFALDRLQKDWPIDVPIAVMGPGSRDKLAERGILAPPYKIISPQLGEGQRFDSEALFAVLDLSALAFAPCLIVRGNGGRTWLHDALTAQGVVVHSVASYQRGTGLPSDAAIAAVHAWVRSDEKALVYLTSSEALAALDELFTRYFAHPGSNWLKRQELLVGHQRIAENATAAGFPKVRLIAPGDEGLMRALE